MLSKKEFITCLDWANLRWPNLDLSKDDKSGFVRVSRLVLEK